MTMIRTLVLLCGFLLVAPALVAQEAPAPAPPTLSERDALVLTVLQQQVQLATQKLQLAVSDLKKPGYRVDVVGNQWRYVADETHPPDGAGAR